MAIGSQPSFGYDALLRQAFSRRSVGPPFGEIARGGHLPHEWGGGRDR